MNNKRFASAVQPRHHVVITGTGRAGTTFLVDLLFHLGLDTGYQADSIENYKHPNARAGLEVDIRELPCPTLLKAHGFVVTQKMFCVVKILSLIISLFPSAIFMLLQKVGDM